MFSFHLVQHGQQLPVVGGLLRDLRSHDHLRRSVHRRLRVVTLQEAALIGPVGHDAAIRVGEVAQCAAMGEIGSNYGLTYWV
jgi:hypothetical protein